MTENISERIENAIKDIENIQIMFRQKYGEECLADKEIEEVLKIAKAEHEELEKYRSIGTVDECREAVERRKQKKVRISHDGVVQDRGKAYCPKCGLDIHGKGKIGACFRCGQAILWEESEGEDD